MNLLGGCLCGTVRFGVTEHPTLALHCHCSICRRAHGAAFGTFTVVKQENFAWTKGELMLGTYASSPGFKRQFCRQCGSHLIVLGAWNPTGITIVLAALDDVSGLKPSCHIFTGSKAAWHEITDSLPQYEEWPPGLGPSVPKK